MESPDLTSPDHLANEGTKPRRIRIPYFADREEQLFLFLTITGSGQGLSKTRLWTSTKVPKPLRSLL